MLNEYVSANLGNTAVCFTASALIASVVNFATKEHSLCHSCSRCCQASKTTRENRDTTAKKSTHASLRPFPTWKTLQPASQPPHRLCPTGEGPCRNGCPRRPLCPPCRCCCRAGTHAPRQDPGCFHPCPWAPWTCLGGWPVQARVLTWQSPAQRNLLAPLPASLDITAPLCFHMQKPGILCETTHWLCQVG